MLRHTADACRPELLRFCALLVTEAFKTWGRRRTEVRGRSTSCATTPTRLERVCAPITLPRPDRREQCSLPARSWCLDLHQSVEFPLAIFMGQIGGAAALVTGNTVVAKPAEQTPVVALEAVKLLHIRHSHRCAADGDRSGER